MRNKSQIFFFLLSVLLACMLIGFLYHNRLAEQARRSYLEQEARSVNASGTTYGDTYGRSSAESVSSSRQQGEGKNADSGAATAASSRSSQSTAEAAEAESTDSEEERAAESDETAIDDLADDAPRIRLTQHSITLKEGDSFSYMDYIASMTDDTDSSADLSRRIALDGSVDTDSAGEYTVTYTVRDSDGNASNRPQLTVRVTA